MEFNNTHPWVSIIGAMKSVAQFRRELVLLLALTITLSLGCNQDQPGSRFVAAYEIEHENGVERLQLFDDGTYTHRLKRSDGSESVSSGKWDMKKVGGKQTILVHNFTPYFPNRSQVADDWPLEPHEDYGLMRLYVSHEPRQFYLELPRK